MCQSCHWRPSKNSMLPPCSTHASKQCDGCSTHDECRSLEPQMARTLQKELMVLLSA
eukprot:NODE_2192_length_979_cov_1.532468.p8 GENE.NODE_2192_length_979_cov_1.532468~~NODE_2192_length_979_cov_1.532468.p8  ORF type:complete len:57 (-),score=0.51 NODE_2192_length_979_cov_1.532468:326-496(-)